MGTHRREGQYVRSRDTGEHQGLPLWVVPLIAKRQLLAQIGHPTAKPAARVGQALPPPQNTATRFRPPRLAW